MQIPPTVLTALAAGAVVAFGVACGDDSSATSTSSTSTASEGSGGNGQGTGGAPTGSGGATSTGAGSSTSGGGGSTTSSVTTGSSSGAGGGFDSCGIGTSPGAGGAGGGGPGSGRVRVVAANLSTGNAQSYDSGHGVRILQGLDADVVLLQEMNFGSNGTGAIAELVDDVCAGECNYMRGPQAQIPNGVLSRLPILECGSWVDPEVDNRNFVWARIDVPGDADLWAISVHFLTSGAGDRDREADALLDHIAGAIPAGDRIVLGGDLNTNSRTEAAIATLSALFETGAPYPVDQDGNGMTNASRDKPYDWVLADEDLAGFEIPVEIGESVFPAGAVIDTRVHDPIADLAPALAGDSGAPSMQHMAVVKDFELGAP